MIPYDEECRRRISRHRKMRAAKGFKTIEVPVGLRGIPFPSALKEGRCALLECMSNLAANEIFSSDGEMRDGEQVVREILEGIDRLQALCEQVIVVTNELFSDGARYDPGTEQYLRALGEINCWIAQRADGSTRWWPASPSCGKGQKDEVKGACGVGGRYLFDVLGHSDAAD